jgi:hypothetical protein
MTLYASVPYRLGLPPESLILFNLGLVIVSSCLAARFARTFWPVTGRTLGFMRYVIAAFAHVAFLWVMCFNSLSDAPAAAFALSGLWLTCTTTVGRGGMLAAGAAGALLGLSAFLRVSYLYPVLVLGAVWAVMRACHRCLLARGTAAFLVALIAPLWLQVARTHAHTGSWRYVDSAAESYLLSLHLGSTLYGYDTMVPSWQTAPEQPRRFDPDLVVLDQGSAVGYEARSCFEDRPGLLPALHHGDLLGALCLIARRQSFYFGSYAGPGVVYLSSPDARVWSPWLCVINGLPLALTLYWLLTVERRVGIIALAFVSSLWLIATVSQPEQRFVAPVSIFTWAVGLSAAWARLLVACQGFVAGRRLSSWRS